MTKKPQSDNGEVFERSLDAATDASIPASDITRQLEAEGLTVLEMGFPELSKLLLDARDEIVRLRGQWLPIESAPTARVWHDDEDLPGLDPVEFEDMRRIKAMEGKRVRLVVVGEGGA